MRKIFTDSKDHSFGPIVSHVSCWWCMTADKSYVYEKSDKGLDCMKKFSVAQGCGKLTYTGEDVELVEPVSFVCSISTKDGERYLKCKQEVRYEDQSLKK